APHLMPASIAPRFMSNLSVSPAGSMALLTMVLLSNTLSTRLARPGSSRPKRNAAQTYQIFFG
ncbi:TPA: hypothetical protein ACPZYR_004871, partial [Escherichia coli]